MACQRDVELVNQLGLHARAAAKLVHVAGQYPCAVEVVFSGQKVDAKSILGLLLLAAPFGSTVQVICDGDREEEAMAELVELIESRFGEGS